MLYIYFLKAWTKLTLLSKIYKSFLEAHKRCIKYLKQSIVVFLFITFYSSDILYISKISVTTILAVGNRQAQHKIFALVSWYLLLMALFYSGSKGGFVLHVALLLLAFYDFYFCLTKIFNTFLYNDYVTEKQITEGLMLFYPH